MRKTASAGFFVAVIIAIIATAGSSKASADALGLLQLENVSGVNLPQSPLLAQIEEINTASSGDPGPVDQTQTLKVPDIQKYIVTADDTLGKIAENHATTWKRLFDKNEAIPHPDLIKPGDEVIIPRPDEVLNERPVPQPAATEPVPQPASERAVSKNRPARTTARQAVQARGTSAGNRYIAGYCTWYAKNMRPDLPNNLGNANTWVSRARAQGISTGSEPRVGAIGQQGMHVVYVQAVNGDGTVTVSEMNFRGRYVISSRTVPASYFQYIY